MSDKETNVREILVERGKSYGKYSTQVKARGEIMSILNNQHFTCQGVDIPPHVEMALNDIVLKLVRVVSDLAHEDNYNDLAGYTELLREMQNEGK